jgi:hypothetical protein
LTDNPGLARADVFTRRAFEMVGSPAVRRAFDLSREPLKLREWYGTDPPATARLRLASSEACRTWASACCWRGG